MNPSPLAVPDGPAAFHPASSPDYVPRKPLRALQSQRLRQVVSRVYDHVPLYRQRMQKHGLTPASVNSVEDLPKLPFTVQADLSDTYPRGMLAVPIQQVVRLHYASGTPGKPVVVAHTAGDVQVWTEAVVRCLAACGIHQGDVLQNACGYDLFADGLGLHYAAEALGATVIPVWSGDADRQIAALKDLNVSAVCSTPGYFLRLLERAAKIGVDLRELPLRAGVFVAETWSEETRRRIELSAGIKAYDLFGLSEIIGPGVAVECCHQDGLHVLEDHFYPEIVDPASGQPLSDGQEGELVLTTLSKEAMPLVRYRTRDITAIVAEPCPCGRTMRRIRRVGRHSEEMYAVQGVNVFPSQIEAALSAVEGALPEYQLLLTQVGGQDRADLQIEVTPQILSDRVSAMERLQGRYAQEIERALGISVSVRLVEPHAIHPTQGKVQRVIDKRNK